MVKEWGEEKEFLRGVEIIAAVSHRAPRIYWILRSASQPCILLGIAQWGLQTTDTRHLERFWRESERARFPRLHSSGDNASLQSIYYSIPVPCASALLPAYKLKLHLLKICPSFKNQINSSFFLFLSWVQFPTCLTTWAKLEVEFREI